MEHITKSLGFFRTTAIGGLILLLPLVFVLEILGYVYSFAKVVHDALLPHLPINSAVGFVVLFATIVALLLLLCFLAGLAAARAVGKTLTAKLERQVSTIFPKYVVYKQLLAGNLGADGTKIILKPALVTCGEQVRPAFETDRLKDGRVVVFFPGSPDTWIGHIAIVPFHAVQPVNESFPRFVEIFERMGEGSSEVFLQRPSEALPIE